MDSPITRDLFGGAITAQTPSNLIDASDIRQVPDSQEVFLYPDSDISIIVEVLQKVEPSDFKDAIRQVISVSSDRVLILHHRFHFDSLAHDNSAASASVNSVIAIPNNRGDDTPSAIVLSGVQSVQKFNHSEPDEVHILMAMYRVERKNVDLIVTFNIPTRTGDKDVSRKDTAAREHFDLFARTLKIVDYGLFA
ncbi:hypothetical protein C0991_008834 [Blastosporella zonata]|nr:hypothetical protein C0991_008834 [Blastosporella zonata]